MTTPAVLHIYTDGACSGNPGPGGWGVWMECPDAAASGDADAPGGDGDGTADGSDGATGAADTSVAGESFSGSAPDTTNNRMELQAIIEALRQLHHRDRAYAVSVFSDSEYIIKAITVWLDGWRQRDYRRGDRKPVKNTDLWRQFDRLRQDYENRHAVKIRWQWVRGHSGNRGNELANTLAQRAAARARGNKTAAAAQ